MTDLDDLVRPLPHDRRLFTNRTLNLRSIVAIGFDMDYTLIHYRTEEWERRAYEYARERIAELGWPVSHLQFSPQAFTLGLVVDRALGNVVKANRFGFVKRATHGTRIMPFEEQRVVYSRVIVDLAEPRWDFMNTLFSLSETCLFAQLVDLLDDGKLPPRTTYDDLYRAVRGSVDAAHIEGALKAEIVSDPDRFVELDADLPKALLDLKHAGKKLLLVTNSEWAYARDMMSWAFDRFVPGGSWRTLFDVVIVGARKPDFFRSNAPAFDVVDDSGLLRPHVGPLRLEQAYLGGNAQLVEKLLDCPGEDILYVGDHVFADVHVTKSMLRWRTALVVRELEQELAALDSFRAEQRELDRLMAEKERLEHAASAIRVQLQRHLHAYGERVSDPPTLKRKLQEIRRELDILDDRIAPLSKKASELSNPTWGPILRAGNDKSHLARQIERYADVYTSRVSNFLGESPFAYLRSPRGSLPHDP
ncbi:MAG TPA: HAD-IG family 5'-nucleotidase [Polyangiaceae bacterium]|nr:HAD-IG family 5'-nucleotidase [Polyangiaceae bacterium]